jgi:catechol 2,3-dioxygenase-like lactoylglutathione lyase family enzyme
MRPHLSLDVRNVPASVQFYQKVFGFAPQKQTVDYAKFDLRKPPLNFSLVSSRGRIRGLRWIRSRRWPSGNSDYKSRAFWKK